MNTPSIIEFCTDPQLLNLSLSAAQETILRALYALPPANDEQRQLYREMTGRATWPTGRPGEVTLIGGARGGKDTRIISPVACYEGLFGGHEQHLAKGERAVIPLVYQDQRASRVGGDYIEAYLNGSPLLKSMVEAVLATEIRLVNRISIMRFPCTSAALRAWSIPVGLMNELGSYAVEGMANADAELQASIRRGMVAFPQSLLLKVSTPWLKEGVLFDDFRRFGEDDPDRIVFRAPSWVLNPALVGRLERERRIDPRRFEREYGAEFADVLAEPLLTPEAVAAVTPSGVRVRKPDAEHPSLGALDMATGMGKDRMGGAIGTHDGKRALLQWCLHIEPPFSPREAIKQFATGCRRYGVSQVLVDKFAPGLVLDLLQHEGIEGKLASADTSSNFISLLMLINGGAEAVSLLDHDVLRRELVGLQRRPSVGGRDIVRHGGGGHDDLAAAVASTLVACAHEGERVPLRLINTDDSSNDDVDEAHVADDPMMKVIAAKIVAVRQRIAELAAKVRGFKPVDPVKATRAEQPETSEQYAMRAELAQTQDVLRYELAQQKESAARAESRKTFEEFVRRQPGGVWMSPTHDDGDVNEWLMRQREEPNADRYTSSGSGRYDSMFLRVGPNDADDDALWRPENQPGTQRPASPPMTPPPQAPRGYHERDPQDPSSW